MPRASVAAAALIWLGSCAASQEVPAPKRAPVAESPTKPSPVDAAAPDGPPAFPDARGSVRVEAEIQTTQLTEAEWRKKVAEKLSAKLSVPAAELRFSPVGTRIAALLGPPSRPPGKKPRRARPPRYRVVVADSNGKRLGLFSVVSVPRGQEPPKDLRFLDEDRLVYEVVLPPPPEPKKPARKKKEVVIPEPKPGPPRRLFVIQPVAGRSRRPVRCHGIRFAFSRAKDRLAFVAGPPEKELVAVNGLQVYPRRGRTTVASDPAWSKDGQSLAFLEARPGSATRLVLIPAFDNPTGDTTWDLPVGVASEELRVFWADEGRLLVGKTSTKPVFNASFTVERSR